MLTQEQTDVVTCSMQEKVMDGIAGAAAEGNRHKVTAVRIPRKAPASEESHRHYNDWPNTQGVSILNFPPHLNSNK